MSVAHISRVLAYHLVVVCVLSAEDASAQRVHRCVIDGRTVFQEGPCPHSLPIAGEEIRRKTEEVRKAREDQEAAAARAMIDESQMKAREPEPERRPSVDAGGLCKGAIGLVMGRDPSTMSVTQDGAIWIVSYVRPSDNSTWKQQCQVSGPRLLWGSHLGRWRNEDNLSYSIDAVRGIARFVQKHSDGSQTEKSFRFEALQH